MVHCYMPDSDKTQNVAILFFGVSTANKGTKIRAAQLFFLFNHWSSCFVILSLPYPASSLELPFFGVLPPNYISVY